MAMYCPRCASAAVEGQRFCRNCGMNLDVILNALEGKQPGPLDFERLKRDLRDLGANLRTGFEEASSAIKKTNRINQPPPPHAPFVSPLTAIQPMTGAELRKEINNALHKVRVAHTRKYSLQQATLALLGGGAWMAVWYKLLEQATNSGLLDRLELIILQETGTPVFGLVPVLQMLWLLGLIPVARGVAHLINGIFFAPKVEKEQLHVAAPAFAPPQSYVAAANPPVNAPAGSSTTNDLQVGTAVQPQTGVTEDETLPLGVRKQSQF